MYKSKRIKAISLFSARRKPSSPSRETFTEHSGNNILLSEKITIGVSSIIKTVGEFFSLGSGAGIERLLIFSPLTIGLIPIITRDNFYINKKYEKKIFGASPRTPTSFFEKKEAKKLTLKKRSQ